MEWADLTKEQQCVLLNAVEESYLWDVLTECMPGPNWPDDRLPQIPRLAQIVEGLIAHGLVGITRDAPEGGQPPVDVPPGQAHDLLADPENWRSPDLSSPFALTATAEGRAIFRA